MTRWPRLASVVVAAVAVVASAACTSTGGASATGAIDVVAAESFWGSIAAQLGGTHVRVRSIVKDPTADPHDYESTSADARAVAIADEVVVNGAGYDPWADKLVKANASGNRGVVRIADTVGAHVGDNPHLWYNPTFVDRAADRITADYQRRDPAHRTYFAERRSAFEQALRPYHDLIASIRGQYAGTKVGATETLFEYMAQALGLDLVSPSAFMQAVAEGNDPPAASVTDFQQQLAAHTIKVLVFNAQTATAVTTNIKRQAAGQHIPTVPMTETLPRASTTFQAWQTAQLQALQRALAGSVGR